MVAALDHRERIVLEILRRDIPGRLTIIAEPADVQALSLADRMIHEALMLSDHDPMLGHDIAGLGWQIGFQEIAELTLANEADTGAVFLVVRNQAQLGRKPPDFGL